MKCCGKKFRDTHTGGVQVTEARFIEVKGPSGKERDRPGSKSN